MPPQQPPKANFDNSPPQQPQPGAAPDPNSQSQFSQQAVPAPSSPTQAVSGIPLVELSKAKQQSLWCAIGALAIFVVGLFFGLAALLGAFLGAIAIRKARLVNYTAGLALGLAGAILNLGFYVLVALIG